MTASSPAKAEAKDLSEFRGRLGQQARNELTRRNLLSESPADRVIVCEHLGSRRRSDLDRVALDARALRDVATSARVAIDAIESRSWLSAHSSRLLHALHEIEESAPECALDIESAATPFKRLRGAPKDRLDGIVIAGSVFHPFTVRPVQPESVSRGYGKNPFSAMRPRNRQDTGSPSDRRLTFLSLCLLRSWSRDHCRSRPH